MEIGKKPDNQLDLSAIFNDLVDVENRKIICNLARNDEKLIPQIITWLIGKGKNFRTTNDLTSGSYLAVMDTFFGIGRKRAIPEINNYILRYEGNEDGAESIRFAKKVLDKFQANKREGLIKGIKQNYDTEIHRILAPKKVY